MDRRDFIGSLVAAPLALVVTSCGTETLSTPFTAAGIEPLGCKSFAYYEGLLPDQLRSSSRSDGTYSRMPCISRAEVEEGSEKTYKFWHGHSQDHYFTLTEVDFEKLAAGQSVEVYTSVVDGHRHALRVSPSESCVSADGR